MGLRLFDAGLVRWIEPADRGEWDLWIKHARERGRPEAQEVRESFA